MFVVYYIVYLLLWLLLFSVYYIVYYFVCLFVYQAALAAIVVVALKGLYFQVRDIYKYAKLSIADMVGSSSSLSVIASSL